LKNIYFICYNHRRNIFVGIFPTIIFFWRACSVYKTIGISFFLAIELETECGITDENYADERILSGIKLVKKLPTKC